MYAKSKCKSTLCYHYFLIELPYKSTSLRLTQKSPHCKIHFIISPKFIVPCCDIVGARLYVTLLNIVDSGIIRTHFVCYQAI